MPCCQAWPPLVRLGGVSGIFVSLWRILMSKSPGERGSGMLSRMLGHTGMSAGGGRG